MTTSAERICCPLRRRVPASGQPDIAADGSPTIASDLLRVAGSQPIAGRIPSRAVLDPLGGSWRTKFDNDQGLTSGELRMFASALGLAEEEPQSYTVEGLARLLRRSGPLWIIGDDAFESNKILHARIVTAVRGDGSVDKTMVTLADPLTGGFLTEVFRKFADRLESKEAVNFGVGVYHW